MGFDLFCSSMFAVLFGLVIAFAGYRLFLALLPFWGFFFGFAFATTTLQALFGIGLLSTVTSWMVGIVIGLLFAVGSYIYFAFAVAMVAGSVGYALGAGLMNLLGLDWGFLVWLVGLGGGIIVVAATFLFKIHKFVIVAATAIEGAAMVVITLMFGYAGLTFSRFLENPVQVALQDSPLWAIFFGILTILGIVAQLGTTQTYVAEAYSPRTSW